MKQYMPSRRTLLLGGAGLAVLGAGIGAWAFTGTLKGYICDIVRDMLKGEPVGPDCLDAFAADYIAHSDAGTISKSTMLARASKVIGASGVDAALGSFGGYATFKRTLVTQFLLGSDYFLRENSAQPVAYLARARVCINPFARFNDD